MMEYQNGLTVRELKSLLADWPEEDAFGEPATVWFMTGDTTSSPVVSASHLNSVDIVFDVGESR